MKGLMKNLAPVVDLLVNSLGSSADDLSKQFVTYSDYVREFRTIDLRVPRRTGKTAILLDKLTSAPSIMFMASRHQLEQHRHLSRMCRIHAPSDLERPDWISQAYYRSSMTTAAPEVYEYMLIDEPAFYTAPQRLGLTAFIEFLHARNALAEDFYVLKLGT